MKEPDIRFRVAPWRTMFTPRQEDADKLLERQLEARVRDDERERDLAERCARDKPF